MVSTSRRSAGVARSSAYTSGSVTLPSRRSPPTGLPSVFSRAVKSSTSSTSWNAIPRFQAYSPSFSSVCVIGPRRQRAQPRAHREQARGLAIHQLHAVGFGDIDAADALQLQQLALHHHLGQPDQQVEDLEIPLAQRDLERLHVKPVARQHASVIAPLARWSTAGRGAFRRRRSRRHAPASRRGSSPPPRPVGWRCASRRRRPAWPKAAAAPAAAACRPLDCRYWPIAVTASTDATDSGSNLLLHLLQIVLDQVEDLARGEGLPQLA